MHFNDNQTQNLRVVDPIADEGVWAMKDDGRKSGCHGEVWRQNAETDESFGPSTNLASQKGTTSNGVGTSTTSGKLKIKSHGHTTAGIRHGDARVRAFT